jgi:hypothetical protein
MVLDIGVAVFSNSITIAPATSEKRHRTLTRRSPAAHSIPGPRLMAPLSRSLSDRSEQRRGVRAQSPRHQRGPSLMEAFRPEDVSERPSPVVQWA